MSGHNLGTLSHAAELHQHEAGKRGLEYVQARLRTLNFLYCWGGPETQERWRQINRHLWRLSALYRGGDCYLAGWKGATPGQRLFPSRRCTERHSLLGWKDKTD